MSKVRIFRAQKDYNNKILTFNDTLTSGITLASGAHIVDKTSYRQWGCPATHRYVSEFNTNTLGHVISADANEAFGEHVATFPAGLIIPRWGWVELNSLCPSGLSATAGEVGLGSVIASGAVATLGGTVTFGDIMDGTTIANHVAGTALTSVKANQPDLTGTKATHGVMVLDGSSTNKKIHLNIASAWNQTATENFAFSAKIRIGWDWIGSGDDE